MKHQTLWGGGRRLPATATLLLATLLSAAPARAEEGVKSIDINFTYTVVSGTCDVTVPGPLTLSPQGVTPNTAWQLLGDTPVAVTLNCKGGGETGKTPAIMLAGTTATTGSATRQKYIVAGGTDNKTGLGVVFGSKADTPLTSGSAAGLAAFTSGRAYIDLKSPGESMPVGASVYHLHAALACGDAADCAAGNIKPGIGKATVVITFEYH
ncbi:MULTISPECIES: fimbrial protein [Serratia]|nr:MULTISPECIES: fimbrial protein [Serratia]